MQSYYVQASTISLAFLGKFIGGVPFNSMRDGVHETFHIFRFFRWYNQQMHKGNLDHSAWRSVSFDQSIWKIFTQLLLMITCSTLMWCLNISIFSLLLLLLLFVSFNWRLNHCIQTLTQYESHTHLLRRITTSVRRIEVQSAVLCYGLLQLVDH